VLGRDWPAALCSLYYAKLGPSAALSTFSLGALNFYSSLPVLPTSGMCVLPDQRKKSAADEKIRPHTLEALFVDVYKDS
jgi:hypothetical protein